MTNYSKDILEVSCRFQVASLHKTKKKVWSCSFCHVLVWSLSHQFFIKFLFPIRCQPHWTKVKKTNNKLGKGATNISAKTCFSASHSLVANTIFFSGQFRGFLFQDNSETKPRDNPANYVLSVSLTQTAKAVQSTTV